MPETTDKNTKIKLTFSFRKTDKGYIVSGKATPCSSKTKVLNYILKHWKNVDAGYIIIEEAKDDKKTRDIE